MYYFLYILTIVVVFCLACPVFREIHCLFPRKLMAHWVHGDDTPMMSWCRAQILTNYGKLLRKTYTDATSSGLTRGHECDVAGAFHLRSKTLPRYFVLHSYFIPTRLWYTTLYLRITFGTYIQRIETVFNSLHKH